MVKLKGESKMVVKDIEKKIVEAGKHIVLWRKVYNMMCRKCQINMVTASRNPKVEGTQKAVSAIDDFMQNKICPKCRARVDKIVENASN